MNIEGAAKSNPLKLVAVLSAITWNFCEILHIYVIILATLKCQLAFIIGIYYTAR